MALDNFALGDARESLVPFADFIKVDLKDVSPLENSALVAHYASEQCRMLAQKVETRQELTTAKKNGFTLFQGYFFRHPERMRARQIPANQATYLLLLQAISKPEADFLEIEDLIKREPSLCYRLLCYLNSPLLGMSSPVSSVRHALNLLGERELVRWIRMATTLAMGQKKPSDLVLSSLVRARFCELMGPKVKHGESDLFLLGMLSMMDAILEVPIGVVVEKLPLDDDIKAQLVGGKTRGTTPLSPIYDLMVAREAGDWEKVTTLGKQLNLSLYFMDKTYSEAMRWAHAITNEI
jgi:EAL and modified HD-GYP domain-containing signal transduction protein